LIFQYEVNEHHSKAKNQVASHKMTNNRMLHSKDEITKKKTRYTWKLFISIEI